MPLVDLDTLNPDLGTPFTPLNDAAPANPDTPRPGFVDTVTAAFRQDNTLVSTAQFLQDITTFGDDYDRNYSAWNEIKGTPYEDHWSAFTASNSAAETAMLRERIDRENDDRRTLAAAGLGGVFASMAAGIIDPTILIPVGGELRVAANGGFSVTRSALSAARAGLIGSVATEAILQGTQETRPLADSLVTIGTSTVLAGLLGAGTAAFFTHAQEKAAGKALAGLIDGDTGGPPTFAPSNPHAPGGVGAEAVDQFSIDDLTIRGDGVSRAARTTTAVSPLLDANFSPVARARQTIQELFEGSLYQKMHGRGDSLGPAVESARTARFNAVIGQATRGHVDLFSNMKKAGINMSREDFNAAVARAMRNGDQGENEFVSQAADMWRKRVTDPLFADREAVGLKGDAIGANTAESYFPRWWRRKEVEAREFEWKERVATSMEPQLRADYDASVEALAERGQKIDQKIAELRMSPEERAAALTEMKTQGEALDAANPDSVDRVSTINDLRRAAKAARDAGDGAKARAAEAEIRRLKDEGGDDYRAYIKARGELRARYRRVDTGIAGLSDRANKVLQSIADTEEKNLRSLQRLIQKGRKLEREAARLDPDKLADRISELRTQFMDLAERADKAVEKQRAALEAMAEKAAKDPTAAGDLDAAAKARIEREIAAQEARSERMTAIANRLEAAENIDPLLAQIELKQGVDDLVMETSGASLARGGKVARLQDRLRALDPKQIEAKTKAFEDTKRRLERAHNERWATRLDVGAEPSFNELARDIADQAFDTITGKQYGAANTVPDGVAPLIRGPLKGRTLPVRDNDFTDFLENDVEEVMRRHARTSLGDIELARKYDGDPTMKAVFDNLKNDYRDLRARVDAAPDDATARQIMKASVGYDVAKTKAQAIKYLHAQEKIDRTHIEAGRDMNRGLYQAAESASLAGRAARSLTMFNFIRQMGGSLISNFGEVVRPGMVYGMRRYMSEGLLPLLTDLEAVKLSKAESDEIGIGVEALLKGQLATMAELGDPMARGTPIERLLQNGMKVASTWSGLTHWTDFGKVTSARLAMNRILRAATQGGDVETLAELGIKKEMREVIAQKFAEHGEKRGTTWIANTQDWGDDAVSEEARRAFQFAVHKDVNMTIVTRSDGDVPTWAHTPLGRVLLQFRSYNISAWQRVTLRGMQANPRRFIQGMVTMTTFGVFLAALRAWRGGDDRWQKFKAAASNPGYLIGEGLDMSGLLALPIDVANTIEKLTPGVVGRPVNPIKSPMLAAGRLFNPDASMQGESVRFQNVGVLGALGGPSANLGDQIVSAAGIPASVLSGKGVSKKQKRDFNAVVPFGSYLGVREMLQAMQGDSPYLSDDTGEPAQP